MLSDKGRKTQEFLVKTAFDIIVEKGIEALSLDRIVERAGISKGALTYHFKNKHELYKALIEYYIIHMDEEMQKYTLLFEGDPADCLIAGYVMWFRAFEQNNRDWVRVGHTLLSNFSHDPELMEPVRAWYRALYERIEALPKEKQAPALTCIMTLEGFFYVHKFGFNSLSPELKENLWVFLQTQVAHVKAKRLPVAVEY